MIFSFQNVCTFTKKKFTKSLLVIFEIWALLRRSLFFQFGKILLFLNKLLKLVYLSDAIISRKCFQTLWCFDQMFPKSCILYKFEKKNRFNARLDVNWRQHLVQNDRKSGNSQFWHVLSYGWPKYHFLMFFYDVLTDLCVFRVSRPNIFGLDALFGLDWRHF